LFSIYGQRNGEREIILQRNEAYVLQELLLVKQQYQLLLEKYIRSVMRINIDEHKIEWFEEL
jgi:hypothetical protein